jgi:excisionase family DNA binding protein
MAFNAGGETSTDAQRWENDTALMTVQEAARFLNVTVSWIYEHVRPEADDRLPFLKLGKYVRFDARDLREYVDAKREAARGRRRRR